MKKQLTISSLLTIISFSASSGVLLNNPTVSPRLASSVIFTNQDSFHNQTLDAESQYLMLIADAAR
jgi:hypothetical protein